MKQKHILNCPCYNVTSKQEVEDFILDNIQKQQGGYTAAINALKIVKYNKDSQTKQVIDRALIQTPDGVGAQLGFKVLHKQKVMKLDLPGLTLDMANKHHLSMFFLGTTEENNKEAVENVKSQYPNINIVGRSNGFFDDLSEVNNKLNVAKPQLVMISLGSPKQELISAELNKKFPEIIFVGSGGRLDILAGKLKRAPNLYIKLRIEWLYRLIKEPKRFKQQLGLITFVIMLYRSKLLKK